MRPAPTSNSPEEAARPQPGFLDRLLRPFGDVRAGEAGTVLLLLANVFLILAGYYVCRTAREPLILAGGGAQVKSYASAGMAVVLMGFIPLYSWFASRVDRARLIFGFTLFFILNLELFWLGAKLRVPYLGVAFFIWVGIFNNAIIAQFWSYGNDIYRQEMGERLFPVIAIGATLGSPVGSALAERLFTWGVGAYDMLHITAATLAASLMLYTLVERREGRRRSRAAGAPLAARTGGFGLLARSPYLRLICLLLVLLNLVNTTGNYVLDAAVTGEAARRSALDPTFDEEAFLGAFYGSNNFWFSLLAVLLQALVVSRIMKYLGLPGVLLTLPVLALGSYGMVASFATFTLVRLAKIAENATDYSVMNTARHMIWLPTTREEKYKAKQAADTFIVRTGDVMSAGLVWLGTHVLGLGQRGFAAANVLICLLWLAVGLLLLRENRALSVRRATENGLGPS